MEFFRIHKTIPFMRYSHILNAVSIVSFLFAVYWIFMHGLAFSIEFTGGTQVVVNYPEAVSAEDVRNTIQEGLGVDAAVQKPSAGSFLSPWSHRPSMLTMSQSSNHAAAPPKMKSISPSMRQ